MIIQIDGRPFDRWICGESTENRQEYLIHMGKPRFACKLGPEEECHISGLTVGLGGGDVAYDFVFFADIPGEEELILIMEDAAAALDRDTDKPLDDLDLEE